MTDEETKGMQAKFARATDIGKSHIVVCDDGIYLVDPFTGRDIAPTQVVQWIAILLVLQGMYQTGALLD